MKKAKGGVMGWLRSHASEPDGQLTDEAWDQMIETLLRPPKHEVMVVDVPETIRQGRVVYRIYKRGVDVTPTR